MHKIKQKLSNTLRMKKKKKIHKIDHIKKI